PVERAVGPGARPRGFRTVRQGPARRQLRRRPRERVPGEARWHLRAHRIAPDGRWTEARHRRTLGVAVRAWDGQQRPDRHAVLHGRPERRCGRSLRLDYHGVTCRFVRRCPIVTDVDHRYTRLRVYTYWVYTLCPTK